jgi:hypothetical protein
VPEGLAVASVCRPRPRDWALVAAGIRVRIEKKIGKSSVGPIPHRHSKCWGLAILRRGVESEIAADP